MLTESAVLLATFKPVRATVSSAVSAQPNDGLKAKPKPAKGRLFSEIRFDLLVVRWSMFVEFCSHALVVFCPLPSNDAASTWWSQCMFVGATSLASAGAGVIPAAQSLALCTVQGRKLAEKEEIARLQGGTECVPAEQDPAPESGKLFGAIAVLQAVSQTLGVRLSLTLAQEGPRSLITYIFHQSIVFGVIYSDTVASFPKAIFAMAGVLVIVAIVLTLFVRPDVSLSIRKKKKPGAVSRHRAEETRGRSRASKDLRGGSAGTSYYGATRYGPSMPSTRTEAGASGHA